MQFGRLRRKIMIRQSMAGSELWKTRGKGSDLAFKAQPREQNVPRGTFSAGRGALANTAKMSLKNVGIARPSLPQKQDLISPGEINVPRGTIAVTLTMKRSVPAFRFSKCNRLLIRRLLAPLELRNETKCSTRNIM